MVFGHQKLCLYLDPDSINPDLKILPSVMVLVEIMFIRLVIIKE